MKIINFIRHARLAQPYDDYVKLSFSQIAELARGELNPSIDPSSAETIEKKFGGIQIQAVVYGPSARAKQTAELIKKVKNNSIELIENKNLVEIHFDPRRITTQDEYKRMGMDSIRRALFQGMFSKNENSVEKVGSVFARIKNLEKELQNMPQSHIFCVTHSFYMRVLVAYFLQNIKNSLELTPDKLLSVIDYGYLDGFEISLE